MRDGWTRAAISDVAIVQSGSGFPKKYQGHADQAIPFYKVSDMNIPGNEREMVHANNTVSEDVRIQLGASVFPRGSTIFPKIGGAIATNKKRQTTRRSCVDNNVMGVIPKTDSVISDFLFYFFLAHDLSEFANEAHLPSIRKTVVESWGIELPDSRLEQQRIVDILEEAFAAISTARENAEKNLRNARALFESHLDSVFSWPAEGWVERRLEQAAAATCTLSYGIVQPGEECANGLPVVRPTDLTTKVIPVSGLKRIDPKRADAYGRTSLQGGELLLCVRGSTGVVAVASAELAGANVTRGIVPIRFDAAALSQDFGYYLLSSGAVQRQVREKTYGAALMQVNIRDLRNITVSFPPLSEQETIVARLDELSSEAKRLESIYQHRLAAIDELKKSLLHQAFTGQLGSHAA